MKILLVSTSNFNVVQINNVSNIAYSDGVVTITYTGGSGTYSLSQYKLQIIW